MSLNDSELEGLFLRARSMDPQALGQLHDLYYPQIYRYIYFYLNDERASQEMTDSVLQDLLDSLRRGLTSKGKLDSWLLKSADSQLSVYRRRISKSRAMEAEQVIAEKPVSSDASNPQKETSQGRRLVQRALSQLDPEQQRILALRYAQALSPDEIASLTGKKLAEVKTLQFRGLRSLRHFLEAAT